MTQAPPMLDVPPRPIRRWRRRHTIGCLGSLILAAIIAIAVDVLLDPWAFHIGGSFTPSESWTGVAEGTAPGGGGEFAMQIHIQAGTYASKHCSANSCFDFEGSAKVCTATGEYTLSGLVGDVGGWASVEGQKMSVQISGTVKGEYTQIDLTGVWHGGTYQANDEGYLVRAFDKNGVLRTEVSAADKADAVTLPFKTGDFDALCARVRK